MTPEEIILHIRRRLEWTHGDVVTVDRAVLEQLMEAWERDCMELGEYQRGEIVSEKTQ